MPDASRLITYGWWLPLGGKPVTPTSAVEGHRPRYFDSLPALSPSTGCLIEPTTLNLSSHA